MDRIFIKKCLQEALAETYDIFRYQGAVSNKQRQFMELVANKLLGEETAKPPEVLKGLTCSICSKKCSTTSGLTLHKKKHNV